MKDLLSILFLCLGLPRSVQNLIQNLGLEIYTSSPTTHGGWNHSTYWSNINNYVGFEYPYASPDYLHKSTIGEVKLPNTTFADVDAQSGRAIMGYISVTDLENYRE